MFRETELFSNKHFVCWATAWTKATSNKYLPTNCNCPKRVANGALAKQAINSDRNSCADPMIILSSCCRSAIRFLNQCPIGLLYSMPTSIGHSLLHFAPWRTAHTIHGGLGIIYGGNHSHDRKRFGGWHRLPKIKCLRMTLKKQKALQT